MQESVKEISDYLAIFRRRKLQILLCTLLIFVVSAAIAFGLPPVYVSTATILIEKQDIPSDLVRSTITSYAAERVQVIKQRVMTRTNLLQVVEKLGLFPEERRLQQYDEIVSRLKEDISVELVSADVNDPLNWKGKDVTIAFTVSIGSDSPDTAQVLANEVASLFLSENVKARTELAGQTSKFLAAEADTLNQQIHDLETELADFKEKNAGRLPELEDVNMRLLESTEADGERVEERIRALEERKILLQGQLAQLMPYAGISPQAKLVEVESSYLSLSAVYASDHPDLIRLRREIEVLRKESGDSDTTRNLAQQLANARAELLAARERYSDEHPDIKKYVRSVQALEETLRKLPKSTPPESAALRPDNPAYLNVQTQLDAVDVEIRSARAERFALRAKLAEYENRLMQTPEVERKYLALTRDYDNAKSKYAEFKKKLSEAEVAERLERDAKGERFALIDPPQRPEQPDKPNRPAILLLGLVFSFGGGFGYAALVESFDQTVRGAKSLMALLNAPPLAVIPYIRNSQDVRRKRWLIFVILTVLAGIVALATALIHFRWMPLDVLWITLLDKFA
jgi:Uncharacterized protein involved in exopolysaccharide biosynthesis